MAYTPSQSFINRVAQLESGGNPLAKNPKTSASGLFQFIKRTAKQYGLDDPFDAEKATEAFKALTADNYETLKDELGREPTEAELYLAHQQGATGALKILSNPEKSAVDVVGKDEVLNNGGNEKMSAADFAKIWARKFDASTGKPTKVDFPDGAQGTFAANTPQKVIEDSIAENIRYSGQQPDIGSDPIGAGRYLAENFGNGGNIVDPLAMMADSGQIVSDAPAGGMLDFSGQGEAVVDLPDFSAQGEPVEAQAPSPEINQNTGGFRTFIDQFNQGTFGGWGDEITDRMGAAYATLGGAGTYEDLLPEARRTTQENLAAQRIAHPILSTAANIGGGVTGAIGAGKFIPKGVATPLGNFTKANPNIAAGLIGGGGAGVYSAGASDKTGLERLSNVPLDAGLGVVGGVAGAQALRQGSRLVNNLASRIPPEIKAKIAQALASGASMDDAMRYAQGGTPATGVAGGILDGAPDMATQAAAGTAPLDLSPTKLIGMLDEEDAAKLTQGRVLPLTKGQRGQNVKVQRAEEIAYKAGSVPFQKAAAEQQAAAYKPFTGMLGDDQLLDAPDLAGRQQDEILGAAKIVRDQYDDLGRRVKKAYDVAGETNAGIAAKNIQDDFLDGTRAMLAEDGLRHGDIPALDKHFDDLQELLAPKDGGGLTVNSVKLKEFELWKKRLNRTIGDTGVDQKSTLRSLKMVGKRYDEFLSDLADDAIVNGDETAIKAFQEARGLAKEKFSFEESDKTIAKILENRDLSGTELVNTIMGATKLSGKGEDGRIAETMLRLAGDKAPMMRQNLQRGVMAKVLRDSLSGVKNPEDLSRDMLSFAKMKTSLGSLMAQREMFGAVFDDTEQKYFKQLYKDLDLISSKQAGAVNNSSTGTYMADFIEGMGKVINNPVFKRIPAFGAGTTFLQSHLEKQAASIVTGKAEAGLGEFVAQAINEIDAPKVFYGAYGGQFMNDPISNDEMDQKMKDSYKITVRNPKGQ